EVYKCSKNFREKSPQIPICSLRVSSRPESALTGVPSGGLCPNGLVWRTLWRDRSIGSGLDTCLCTRSRGCICFSCCHPRRGSAVNVHNSHKSPSSPPRLTTFTQPAKNLHQIT